MQIQENSWKLCLETLLSEELPLKERICPLREQITSGKSSPNGKEVQQFMLMSLDYKMFLMNVTRMRICVMSIRKEVQ